MLYLNNYFECIIEHCWQLNTMKYYITRLMIKKWCAWTYHKVYQEKYELITTKIKRTFFQYILRAESCMGKHTC